MNPRPLRYLYNVLPTELSKPHEDGGVWVRPLCSAQVYGNTCPTVAINEEMMTDANAAIANYFVLANIPLSRCRSKRASEQRIQIA